MPIADSMGDDEEDFVDELERAFAGDGDVMDMADQDDRASLAESHVNELDDVFEDEVACHGIGEEGGPAADARPGVGRSGGDVGDQEEIAEDFAVADMGDDSSDVLAGTGSASEPGGHASSIDEPPPAPFHAVAEEPPEARMSDPGALGYCYMDGRSVLRIQRGKPKGSVTINCYRHTGCALLLSTSQCPDDVTLKRWCLEVAPSLPDATPEERKVAAREHMGLAYWRWRSGAG